MAWFFGDSFDFYSTLSDAVLNYWDSGSISGSTTLVAGRFTGSQAVQINNLATTTVLNKSSGANDTIHHIICSVRQTAALSGSILAMYLQLLDGTTPQCTIVFRSDGAILLTSGAANGTVLAIYTGAVSAQNTWTAFEFEIVINNTTGSFTARKNGNTSNDFTLGSLNTRGGTANNYANRLILGMQANLSANQIDDLLWRSDPTTVAWLGDIRAYQQMPNGDVSNQFTAAPNPISVPPTAAVSTVGAAAAGAGRMGAFTAPASGVISSGTIQVSVGATGNMKAAIYDSTRTNVLATSNQVVNPGSGNIAITFITPLTVVRGTQYWLAVDQDVSITYGISNATAFGVTFTTPYASFPATAPTTLTNQSGPGYTLNLVPTNSGSVSDLTQDGVNTYVYDSTVGHADFYSMTPLAASPSSIVAVTTKGFMAKSDAGTRNGQLQLKSGATTVQSGSLFLSTNFLWNYRTDVVDPNTGLAWTAAAVNASQIGPLVAA